MPPGILREMCFTDTQSQQDIYLSTIDNTEVVPHNIPQNVIALSYALDDYMTNKYI